MAGKKQMYKVELYLECPPTLVPPNEWDWEAIVNHGESKSKQAPVRYVIAVPVEEGTA